MAERMSPRGVLLRALRCLATGFRLSLLVATLFGLAAYIPTPAAAAPQASTQQILAAVAQRLGWPATTSQRSDIPGQAIQVTSDGRAEAAAIWATVSIMGTDDDPTLLELLEAQGATRGVFHGREAVIVRPGDRTYDGAEAASAPGMNPATPCRSTQGLIAWRCGPYVFAAQDTRGEGREMEVAEALYAVAEQQGLCGPSSVVILAQTADTPGRSTLYRFRLLAQATTWYYTLNGYGRVDIPFTLLDADGPAGANDWYTAGPSASAYAGQEMRFAIAAVQRAFAGMSLPESTYLERAIIVCPSAGELLSAQRRLFSTTFWLPAATSIEVSGAGHTARIYVRDLVLLSEDDELGTWVHEVGHTLYSKYTTPSGYHRILDRYEYDQPERRFGHVGLWDLMGTGSRWGNPEGKSPTQMSSYTKEAANWLRYTEASLDREYTLTALENQVMGDLVLRLDDPLSSDPSCYYIIEARDANVFFGAPESGVVIYHVTYDHRHGHAVVNAISSEGGEADSARPGLNFEHATLHGVNAPDGAREYVNASAGFKVTLVAESFSAYKATVRIERYQAN